MGRPGSRPAELALPVASLAAIRESLTKAVGADEAARALRAAGHAAGDAVYAALTQPLGADPGSRSEVSELNATAFWRRISQLFSTRGWGTLNHSDVHDGVASLESTNWVEAEPGSAARPTCFFTTGLLANLLGQAAGSDVAILEVECRSRGDERCRFVFGAPQTIDDMYDRLRAGASVDDTIAALVQVPRILGIDYGTRRLGLALSDPSATIAQPLPTLMRRAGKRAPVQALADIVQQQEVSEIVIGLPLSLNGDETEWTAEVREFGAKLAQRTSVPVSYLDERMTSVQAEKTVRSLGLKRSEREQKDRVDAAAALLILQAYLDRRPRA